MGLLFSVPEKKSVSEKCILEKKFTLKYCIGKEIYSQIFYRKRKWLTNIGIQTNCVFSSLLSWKGATRVFFWLQKIIFLITKNYRYAIRVTNAILPKVPQLILCDFIKQIHFSFSVHIIKKKIGEKLIFYFFYVSDKKDNNTVIASHCCSTYWKLVWAWLVPLSYK